MSGGKMVAVLATWMQFRYFVTLSMQRRATFESAMHWFFTFLDDVCVFGRGPGAGGVG